MVARAEGWLDTEWARGTQHQALPPRGGGWLAWRLGGLPPGGSQVDMVKAGHSGQVAPGYPSLAFVSFEMRLARFLGHDQRWHLLGGRGPFIGPVIRLCLVVSAGGCKQVGWVVQ